MPEAFTRSSLGRILMDKRTATNTVRERRGQRRDSASPRTRLAAESSAPVHVIDLENREVGDGPALEAAPHDPALDGAGRVRLMSPAAGRPLRLAPDQKAVSGTVASKCRARDTVANSGSSHLSFIDVATKRKLRRIPVGRHPHGVVPLP